MSEVESKSQPGKTAVHRDLVLPPGPIARGRAKSRFRMLPVLVTLVAVAVALPLGWASWNAYMEAPWTRDGTVRAYVVTMAPEVAGRIVALPVADNRFVHKGDLLLVIDPVDYTIAVGRAEAALRQAEVNAQNAAREAKRRAELPDLAVSREEQQTFQTTAVAAQAQYQQAQANLQQARVNLARTQIRSPVNGWVTNLLAQLGDYASIGTNIISVVNADSFWIDGYFEETSPRRRSRDDQADGLQPDRSWPCCRHRPRHQCRERATQSAGPCYSQSDFHVGAACPTRSGAHCA